MRTLTSVSQHTLVLSDGSSVDIPHREDTTYTTFFFVRHAERNMDGGKDPELTVEGRARAERLGRIMENCPVDSVFSTPYQRTRQTAEPVQRRCHSPLAITYLPENQTELLDKLIPSSGGKRIFIVGHQNTVPMALNYLKGDFSYRNIADYDFGKFYVVVTDRVGHSEIMEFDY